MKPEIYKNEGYQFMGAAFEVYNDRGCGLTEEIYQERLEIELELRRISFRSKAELKCFYKGPGTQETVRPGPVCVWLPGRGAQGGYGACPGT
jgi:GxxExxY protein